MKPLAPGLQVEGLQVQALLRRTPRGFVYLVVDAALERPFELEEFAPGETIAVRSKTGAIAPAPGAETLFNSARKHFLDDARLESQLDNPGLPQVLRVIEAQGTVFALRPAREGQTLAALLQAGKHASKDSIKGFLDRLASALQALHDAGRTHGALGTREILLDRHGQPFLATPGGTQGAHRPTGRCR